MYLHLDQHFKPFGGSEIAFEAFVFSGGEPHIRIQPFDISEPVTVTHRLRSFQDVGVLCLAADALRRIGAQLDTLFIPYFPAARQDRVMTAGEPLSAKVYADIINALGFARVQVFDPHSDVVPALLNRCEVISNHDFIRRVLADLPADVVLISPDGGALKKIYKLSEALGGKPVVECSKSRDVKTGNLNGFKVYADDLNGKPCLIVDDICDGGGTFVGLADVLRQKNAGSLFLAVSHGIFSRGLAALEPHFTRVFTTNSFQDTAHPALTIYPL